MPANTDTLLPTTLAIEAVITASCVRRPPHAPAGRPRPQLLIGDRPQWIPSSITRDGLLEPIDKLVWLVIMQRGCEATGVIEFPDYTCLAQEVNTACSATVSRAITILRLTRRLTFCGLNRRTVGRGQGNVYVLHVSPLPLVDTLHLDKDYVSFLTKCVSHHHARVRRVATMVSASLETDIKTWRETAGVGNISAAPDQNLLVDAPTLTVLCSDEPTEAPQPNDPPSLDPPTTASSRTELMAVDEPGKLFTKDNVAQKMENRSRQNLRPTGLSTRQNLTATEPQGQNFHVNELAKRQNLTVTRRDLLVNFKNCSECNNKNLNKTTTTTITSCGNRENFKDKNLAVGQDRLSPLVYPARLLPEQMVMADALLEPIPPELRQPVLDEFQGRLLSEQKGMKPVYDEMRFLRSLCTAAQAGTFVPNFAVKVVAARKDRERYVVPSTSPEPTIEALKARERSLAVGAEYVAKIGAMLNQDE